MANLIQGAHAPTLPVTGELTICIFPRGYDEWRGSRAQIEAEGFSPPDGEWPERDRAAHWSANGFDYWLERTRPEGLKGPKALWVEGDYWVLRRSLTSQANQGLAAAYLYQKRQELADLEHRQTPEWRSMRNRWWESFKDKRFQAFKAACGIVEKQRGRPRKAQTSEQGESNV